MRIRFVRSRQFLLSGTTLAALLAIGTGSGQAANPFVAGSPSTRMVAAPAGDVARAEGRGKALMAALGIPAASHRAARLDDAFEHRTYDEVTSFDGRGKEIAISRFDPAGNVAMAVRLDWQPGTGRRVDASGAARGGDALARAAGLTVHGRPEIRPSTGAGGWSISWPRVVNGVAVRGDGIRI
ncbi:MAG: hypothetical protein QOF49_199, partial [Chloroflexota bacterium]|nr:hypothetical protein [Chloroflexota bacterium]